MFIALFSVDDCVSSNENLGSVSRIEMAWGGTITMETVLDFKTFAVWVDEMDSRLVDYIWG